MAKIKKEVMEVQIQAPDSGLALSDVHEETVRKIHPLTQEFGNGDLNILRDKINEIIGL